MFRFVKFYWSYFLKTNFKSKVNAMFEMSKKIQDVMSTCTPKNQMQVFCSCDYIFEGQSVFPH